MAFNLQDALAATAQGKSYAADAPPSAPPSDGGAPADLESSVIDVGGPRYSPAIPKGQQGSQVEVTPGAGADAQPAPKDALTAPPPPSAGAAPPKFNLESALTLTAHGKFDSGTFAKALPPPPPEGQMEPLPPAPQPSQQSVTQPNKGASPQPDTDRPMEWSDVPKTFAGSTVATLDGIQRGLLGDKVTSGINAAAQTPFRMATGWQGPSAAFNEGYDADQKQHQAQQDRYPIADVGGQVGGAVAGGMAASPALGLNAATGILPKLGAAGSYIARNAAFGGGMAAASGNDPTTGAALGGAFPAAHLVGKAALGALTGGARAIENRLGPLIGGRSGQAASVGRTLNSDMAGGPSAVQSSPVGSLTLAQATANPKIAAMEDIARPYAGGADVKLKGDQTQSIRQQIGKIGQAAPSAPDAAIATTDAVRAAHTAAEAHETALWNAPELKQTQVPTGPIKDAVKQAMADLPFGLKLGVTGNVKAALNHLNSAPDTLPISELNSIRTAFRRAGSYDPNNPSASAVAAHFGHAVTDGMDQVLANTPGVSPKVAQQWHEAREFTRQLRTGPMSHPQIEPMLKDGGVESKVGANAFRFGTGQPEGPEALKAASDFIQQIPGGGQLSADVIQATRNHIATAMQAAADLGTGALQKFLKTNSQWLQKSGVMDKAQISAITELSDYTDMLRKPTEMLSGIGSRTYDRTELSKNFITQIMSPMTKRIAEMAGAHTHGALGYIATHAGTHFVGAAEDAMRELKARALFDPQLASDLMMKASKGNLAMMRPANRGLYLKAQSAINDVLAQEAAPSASPPALQMSH